MILKQQECSTLKCNNKASMKKLINYHHPNGDQTLRFCLKCFPEQIAFMDQMKYKYEVIRNA